ncbi:MAG: L-lactate dehydrogenase, partial [Myxococcota bacterium]
VGEDRLELLNRNVDIFKNTIPPLVEVAPEAVFVIVSNPVDVMSYISWKISGLDASQIIGSGTLLDTARFRYILGERLSVDPRHIHAYILGEHGDSEVAAWSRANISGVPVENAMPTAISAEEAKTIAQQVKDAAQEVIRRKGATCYAIGLGVTRLVQGILQDQKRIMTISCLLQGQYGIEDVYLSLPAVVGSRGIEHVLCPPLNEIEEQQLKASAQVLRKAIAPLALDQS